MARIKKQTKKTTFQGDLDEVYLLKRMSIGGKGIGFFVFLFLVITVASFGLYQLPRVVQYLDSGILLPKGELSTFIAGDTAISRLTNDDIKGEIGTADVLTADDPFIGDRDRSVMHIIAFEDFDCPFCGQFYYTIKEFVAENPNAVFFQFRDFPIESLHPDATRAALAANCAQEYGKFWQYHDILFEHQGTFTRDNLISYAVEAGLARTPFTQCLDSQKYLHEVQVDYQDGYSAGVRGTPTLYINNVRLPGAISKEVLEGLLDKLRTTQSALSETIDTTK